MNGLETLRTAIRQEVLIRSKDAHITDPFGVSMPWLFDFRAISLDPARLPLIADLFWERFEHLYPFQVGGQETAAISLVAAIVMKSVAAGKPVNGFFLRKSRKREGLMKTIEGKITSDPVILVDDLVNSGSTFNRQLEVLRAANVHVTDIFAILSFRAKDAYPFEKNGIRLTTLFSLDEFGFPLLTGADNRIPKNVFTVEWKFESGSPSFHHVVQKSAPVIDNERIYFGTDTGVFFALKQSDGSTVWSRTIGNHPRGKGIFSSPSLCNGTVYFGAYDGNVYALNAATGKKEWIYMDADWIGSSPALAPDLGLLFIGLEFGLFKKRGGIAALSLKNGKRMWEHSLPEHTHSSPVYIPEERAVLIGGNEQMVYCFDATTGALRWSDSVEGDHKASFAYDKKNRRILFGTLGSTFYSLSMKNGSVAFAIPLQAGIYSTPLISRDTVFVTSLDKQVRAIDTTSGEERWAFQTAGRIFSTPVLADGSLWIGSNDGRLYELHPSSGKLLGFFQATERIVNKIAYNATTGRFFVPTVANELYCLSRKSST